MRLRRFNPPGIEKFREYLSACRTDPALAVPRDLLEDDARTEIVHPELEVEPQRFVTRADAANYLIALLAPLPEHVVNVDSGLWTWLTLFFFDEVCPAEQRRRGLKVDSYYILNGVDERFARRHLLRVAWRVLCVAPLHNRLLLHGKISSLDKVTEKILERLYLTRIPCIFEVLDRLYWDSRLGRPRKGLSDYGKVWRGDLMHRFPLRIRQLEMTYDLFSLSADQLIELLGSEFQSVAVTGGR